MSNKTKKKGFTIVELVIVIGVIAILAAVLIPTFTSVTEKANKSAAMQEARNEFEVYMADHIEDLTGKEDYVVQSGNYFFKVENLQFNTEAYKTVDEITWTEGATEAEAEQGTESLNGTTAKVKIFAFAKPVAETPTPTPAA